MCSVGLCFCDGFVIFASHGKGLLNMEIKTLPSIEQLKSILRCDGKSGRLFWKERPRSLFSTDRSFAIWNKRYAGKEAFSAQNAYGYHCGAIFNQGLFAHRVIWAMETGSWPESHIDHINGIRTDNRIQNLRVVSAKENQRNMAKRKSNRSGACGVSMYKDNKRWIARIKAFGKTKHIGLFESIEEAVAARKAAELQFGYHENHGRHQAEI
jgi:hypothetical protein